MRNLARNCTDVWYKLYEGNSPVTDEYGNYIGVTPVYGELESASMSVSPNKGTSEAEMFGSLKDYDRTMITSDMDCPIDENTILWLDGADTAGPHTHTVILRAPSINQLAFAIKKVEVSHEDTDTGD